MTEAQSPEKTEETWTRRLRWLAAAVFAALYLLMLSATAYPTVFPSGRPARLAGPDAYFHLRHAEAALANYPRLLRPDPMTNFPHGEIGINQGFFDLSVATVSKISLGLLSPKAILIVISPLCALLALLWCARWLSRESGDLCAGLFLLFSLAYPASLNSVAALGQGDHHAFELFMAVTIAWSLKWLFRPTTSWKMAPIAALPLLWLYFSWAGAPLQLLLVGGVFYFRAWNPEISDERLAAKGSLYGLTMLIVVGGMDLVLPWTTIWHTSYQLFLLAGTLLFAGYPFLVRLAGKTSRFPALGASGLLVLGLVAAIAFPTTRGFLLQLVEQRTDRISEHVPITLGLLHIWYGPLWVLAIFGVLLLLWRRKLWWANLPLVYAGGLVLFWLQTRDFVYYSPPPLAAAAAYALTGWRWKKLTSGLALVVTLIPVIPGAGVNPPWMSPQVARDAMLISDGLESASAWLREVEPANKESYGILAPWDLGNILAQTTRTPVGWSQTVSTQLAQLLYSDRPDAVYRQLSRGEKRFRYIYLPARNLAEKFISEMGVAGIPVGAAFSFDRNIIWEGQKVGILKTLPPFDTMLLNRLYWGLGENLGHYRLVYESAEQSLHTQKLHPEKASVELHSRPVSKEEQESLQPLLRQPNVPLETSRGIMVRAKLAPEVRIFELVPGAVVTGNAAPGTAVMAQLRLHSPTSGRSWLAHWRTQAGAGGVFLLRLPYPTTGPISRVVGTVVVQGPYKITVGTTVSSFQIDEYSVSRGTTLKMEKQKKL